MTIICTGVPTKKALREQAAALSSGDIPASMAVFQDPSIFQPLYASDRFTLKIASLHMRGMTFVCTNHPKRSWFAEVSIGRDGTVKVL